MLKYILFNQTYNLSLLEAELNTCLNTQWVNHFNTKDYNGAWQSTSLRSATGLETDILAHYSVVEYQNTPLLEKLPYIKSIIEDWKCEKESIRLLALHPGSEIKPHQDLGCNYKEGTFRLHIPILTNDKVVFNVADKSLKLNAGSCWYIDFTQTHSIKNEGDNLRVHLIIDCLRNEWTDKLFSAHGYDLDADNRPPIYDTKTIKLMIAELERMNTDTAKNMILKLKNQHQ